MKVYYPLSDSGYIIQEFTTHDGDRVLRLYNIYDKKWVTRPAFATKDDTVTVSSNPTDWTNLKPINNSVISMWTVSNAGSAKGSPSGCYAYGTLILLNGHADADWKKTLIYISDSITNSENKVGLFIRTNNRSVWNYFSPTTVNCIS